MAPVWVCTYLTLACLVVPRPAESAIEGYATSGAVAQGDTLALHISTNAIHSVLIEDALDPSRVFAEFHELRNGVTAAPESAFAWGCNWPVTHKVAIDPAWPSGVYYARLISQRLPGDTFASIPDTSFVPFVVLEDQPGSTSNILFQLSTNTYNAYNSWGGRSLYPQNSEENRRAHYVSSQRPYIEERGKGQFPAWERPLAAWLRTEGIPVEFCTNVELHRDPGLLSSYDLFLSVGHDEYWSKEMYDQAEAFREAGGNLAFFSGNSIFWSVRFEGDTMFCYKDLTLDPYYNLGLLDRVTINWRFAPLNRPEGQLIGVQFGDWCWRPCGAPLAILRPSHWTTRGMGLDVGTEVGTAEVGYEWDHYYESAHPEGVELVFESAITSHTGEPGVQHSSFYKYPATNPRSRVFAAGTIQWNWGVRPDSAGADSNLVAITRRIIRCLSQPSVTASDREVVFTADLRHLSLEPENTVWLRGTPAPLDPNSTDFPMRDDGVPPDSAAGDRIHTCSVLFPAGSWNIVDYAYWTGGGPCTSTPLSAWIEDPDLGSGPTVELSPDRPDFCFALPIGVPETPASAASLEVIGRRIEGGVQIEITAPSGTKGAGSIGGTDTPREPRFRLGVYDITGRLVRLLGSGTLGPGRITFLWRGDDERGGRQPSGIYLVRARVGEVERAVKVVW